METVHVGHVAPRTQPVCSETKVTEAGEKPLGTGPPAGPAEGDTGTTVWVGAAVSVAEALWLGAVVGDAVGEAAPGEVPVLVEHAARSMAIAASSTTLLPPLPLLCLMSL
jgi:hypothetical protein